MIAAEGSRSLREEWKTGFSDDLILTKTVKSAGYKIKFLPITSY